MTCEDDVANNRADGVRRDGVGQGIPVASPLMAGMPTPSPHCRDPGRLLSLLISFFLLQGKKQKTKLFL